MESGKDRIVTSRKEYDAAGGKKNGMRQYEMQKR